MKNISEMIKTISPILISPSSSSITIGLSKRFFLFRMVNKAVDFLEEDPYLNFIALLKSYKILGRFLYGTLHEFHRDRNKTYFKRFFYDLHLYELVKKDIEELYPQYKDIKMTLTKRGVIIYDNYRKNTFNVLLLTIHSGTWVPRSMGKKLSLPKKKRHQEEDIGSDKIYNNLVLKKGGIWIDNKQSRFVIDFNRGLENAIYANNSEEWIDVVWKEPPTKMESKDIYDSYREFYFTLVRLIESYPFNIIFDGHTMKDSPQRPNISFGTGYIPKFYMPIVKSMQRKMISLGYSPVLLNSPYKGGYILQWLNKRFPDMFIFSMEVNKRVYMARDMFTISKRKLKKISEEITNIFDIELEEEPENKNG